MYLSIPKEMTDTKKMRACRYLLLLLLFVLLFLFLSGCRFPLSLDRYSYYSPCIEEMLYVPPGQFQFRTAAAPVATLTKGFHMSKTEITREQFQTVMGADPSNALSAPPAERNPVNNVNWYQAIAFCNKLSLLEGLTPVYSVAGITDWASISFAAIPVSTSFPEWNNVSSDWSADGYRLPTYMEWMWAAMGAPSDGQFGSVNTTGYTKIFAGYNGANNVDDYVYYAGNSDNKTHPVAGKLPNELGLNDMSGNVPEWCWDKMNGLLPTGSVTDYTGEVSGTDRWIAGGSYLVALPENCSIDSRFSHGPDHLAAHPGFRVVRR